MKSKTFFIILSLISTCLNAAEENYHIVQKGETLSQIAQDTFPERVYTKVGSLEKLLIFNPEIKNPHIIFVGQKISFAELKAMGRERTAADGEAIRKPTSETAPVVVTAAPIKTDTAATQQAPLAAPINTTSTTTEDDVDHSLVLAGGYAITTFHAVDSTTGAVADLSTSQDLRLGANLNQKWTEGFNSFFSFSVRSINFNPSTNINKTILNTKKTLFNLSVGGNHHVGDSTQIKYWAGYANELFVYGLTSNSLAIDSVAIPSGNIELSYKILSKGKTSLGVTGTGSYYLSSKADGYSVSNGTGYGASIYLRRDYDGKSFGAVVGYKERNQDSSVASNREKNVYGALMYSIPLFKDEQK